MNAEDSEVVSLPLIPEMIRTSLVSQFLELLVEIKQELIFIMNKLIPQDGNYSRWSDLVAQESVNYRIACYFVTDPKILLHPRRTGSA